MVESRSFECALCGRKFTKKFGLKRHIQKLHIDNYHNKLLFECSLCPRKYSRKRDFEYHNETVHENTFECATCAKTYCKRKNLVEHIRYFHRESSPLFECCYCTRTFYKKNHIRSHIHSCRQGRPISNVNRFKCALCNEVFAAKILINQHYRNAHQIMLEIQTLKLKSFEEFKEWKLRIQQLTITQFVNQYSSKSETHDRKLFVCHRSSINRTHSRRKTDNKFPKRSGSKKLHTFCPAELDVRISKADGTCIVNYTTTHIGHFLNDRTELRHVYLTEEERLHIAAQLKDGVPRSEVRKRELLSKSKNLGSRLSVLSSKDIGNIAAAYCISERTFNDDVINNDTIDGDVLSNIIIENDVLDNDNFNVDTFVENNKKSVLFYKNESMEDYKFGSLNENDFVLVFMNETQEKFLQRYAENIVCFDGMHGTVKYGFLLHTLLVLDVDRVGYPAAFFVTNRNDGIAIEIFLSCIKERVGDIKTKVLMTDMESVYYNSWIAVMDTVPEFHLYCTWYVNEEWRKRCSKLPNSRIRREVKRQLHSLQHELNPLSFDQKLASFLAIEEDSVVDFVDYFRRNFAQKPHLWAYCYRQYVGVNVNMALESFHKQIKYKLISNENVNWLSHTLKLIEDYLELRSVEEDIKNFRGVDSSKLKDLRREHHKARKHYQNKNIDEYVVVIDDNTFIVQSFTEEDVSYVVTKPCGPKECARYDDVICGLQCQLCGTCFHEYICNCLHNSIRSSMCRHIHTVGIYNQKHKSCIDASTESVPVIVMSHTNASIEEVNDENIIADEIDENDEEEFEKIRSEAHDLLEQGLNKARIHGEDFLRKWIEKFLVPFSSVGEAHISLLKGEENRL